MLLLHLHHFKGFIKDHKLVYTDIHLFIHQRVFRRFFVTDFIFMKSEILQVYKVEK